MRGGVHNRALISAFSGAPSFAAAAPERKGINDVLDAR